MIVNKIFTPNYKVKIHQFLFLAFIVFSPNSADAGGKGPNGLWPVTERYVLVADKSLPGIILVDLITATVKEQLVMDHTKPVCIASCPNCDFALVTGNGGFVWRLWFKENISTLVKRTGELGLKQARVEAVDLTDVGGGGQSKIVARHCIVSHDGKTAYLAALKNKAVYRLNLTKKNISSNQILVDKVAQPYGVFWGQKDTILVSMDKDEVWRIDPKGQKLATYNIVDAKCPGTKKYNPILRNAIDDPLNDNSLIILANNGKTKDAVIWRLQYDSFGQSVSCSIVAGGIGRSPGWLDSAQGKSAYFSRPHFFAPLPDGKRANIVLTDMDNRALRMVNLLTGSSTSIMYNRARRVSIIPAKEKTSLRPCEQLKWKNATQTVTVVGEVSCIQTPMDQSQKYTYSDAKALCNAQGARLCEPVELKHASVLSNRKTWTSADCASCWQGEAKQHCDANIKTDKKFRSWNSGQAIEVGKTIDSGSSTFCSATENTEKASAFCCADNF